MTYTEILRYQERCMNAMLCQPWFGMTQERERFRLALSYLRHIIARAHP